MTLPKELTTVTPLSKYLAMFLFISLPFVGFFLGLRYDQQFTEYIESRANVDQYLLKTQPTATQSASTANWKTYRNSKYGFELSYPNELKITEEQQDKYYAIKFSNTWVYENTPGGVDGNDYFVLFLDIFTVDPQTNLKDWMIKDSVRPMPDGTTRSQFRGDIQPYDKTGVQGYSAIGGAEVTTKFIYFKNNNLIFKFLLDCYQTGCTYQENPNAEKVLDQILSTFRFIE